MMNIERILIKRRKKEADLYLVSQDRLHNQKSLIQWQTAANWSNLAQLTGFFWLTRKLSACVIR